MPRSPRPLTPVPLSGFVSTPTLPTMPRASALTPTQQAAATTIEGVLERVTYANDDNAWTVVKLVVAGKTDLVTALGSLLGVQPGESLRLSCRWATDKKH